MIDDLIILYVEDEEHIRNLMQNQLDFMYRDCESIKPDLITAKTVIEAKQIYDNLYGSENPLNLVIVTDYIMDPSANQFKDENNGVGFLRYVREQEEVHGRKRVNFVFVSGYDDLLIKKDAGRRVHGEDVVILPKPVEVQGLVTHVLNAEISSPDAPAYMQARHYTRIGDTH